MDIESSDAEKMIEIWRESEGEFYCDSLYIIGKNALVINSGGYAITKPVKEWLKLNSKLEVAIKQQEKISRTKAIPTGDEEDEACQWIEPEWIKLAEIADKCLEKINEGNP